MSKINHERWILRLNDNHTRELYRESKQVPSGRIEADQEDTRSEPRTSYRFERVTREISELSISIFNKRRKLGKRKDVGKPSKKLQRHFDALKEEEKMMEAIAFVICSELFHEREDRRLMALRWFAWRFPGMNIDRHPHEKAMDTIFEFVFDVKSRYTPERSLSSFIYFEAQKRKRDANNLSV